MVDSSERRMRERGREGEKLKQESLETTCDRELFVNNAFLLDSRTRMGSPPFSTWSDIQQCRHASVARACSLGDGGQRGEGAEKFFLPPCLSDCAKKDLERPILPHPLYRLLSDFTPLFI